MFGGFAGFGKQMAIGPLLARIGIVGVNYAVMLGLAAVLGLADYGTLILVWSVALILATVLSCGAPLILLRGLSDGGGMRAGDLARLLLFYPTVIAVILSLFAVTIWSVTVIVSVFSAALALNMTACAASMLRAIGSVQVSMVLRDAAPHVGLGTAALLFAHQDTVPILFVAAILLLLCNGFAVVFAIKRLDRAGLLRSDAPPVHDGAQWLSAVLGTASAQIDLVVGGLFLQADALGLYALMRRCANLVALPVSVATWVGAGDIAGAYNHRDMKSLQSASIAGSRIALLPGFVLCVAGLIVLVALQHVSDFSLTLSQKLACVLLLIAAFGQVWFASGYTVASLCGQAQEAVMARGGVVGFYLFLAVPLFFAPSILGQAAAYGVALSSGSLLLWWRLGRRLGIETSALALRNRKGGAEWRPS